jgi:HAE1 family hydrophobic/amphiphilic exporter-1
VAQVNIIGGQEREIQVNLDATKFKVTDFLFLKCNKIFSSNLDFPYRKHSNSRAKNINPFSG